MKRVRFFLVLIATLLFASGAFAEGWVKAGQATRLKTIGFVSLRVYTVHSYVKEKPKERSKNGLITHQVDKQLLLYMHRDVDADRMKSAFRDAFKLNGYGDTAKIEQFVGALGSGDVIEWDGDLKPQPPASVSIIYNAKTQTTSIIVPGHGKASIPSVEFMQAVWSIWYGKIDQPSMGDQMMQALPKD